MNRIIRYGLYLWGITVLLINCKGGSPVRSDIPSGKKLASIYCGTCHLTPAPDLLDSTTWAKVVLPRMGYMLGFYPDHHFRETLLEKGEAGTRVETANIYPESPQIGAALWEAIQTYYLDEAPQTLPRTNLPSIGEMKGWHTEILAQPGKVPGNTLIQIDSNRLLVGDAQTGKVFQYNQQLELVSAARSKEGAVHIHEESERYLITVMGQFSPTDAANGFIFGLPKSTAAKPRLLIDNLQRPVHTSYQDVNGDRRMDMVVSEYGKWTGQLSLFLQKADGTYAKQILRKVSGAIRSEIRDINGDQLLDIIALFGQGDEGIWAFEQTKSGSFTVRPLLRFPPTYGSSYFTLQDLDADGDEDILYTCGDNADYDPVLKPYHGIYFFENDGHFQFEQSFFYPMDGAYKAIVADFDQDQDLDIAAVSFFPDFEQRPEASFLLLTKEGLGYRPSTFPEVSLSRWMRMDSGDIDGDGDLDLALAALTLEVPASPELVDTWSRNGIGVVVLYNDRLSLENGYSF